MRRILFCALALGTTAHAATVSFTLRNNAPKTVSIFIGTKPKFGSGLNSSIGGNTTSSFHGSTGNQLCIVQTNGDPISCMTLESSTSKVEINAQGTGFGR